MLLHIRPRLFLRDKRRCELTELAVEHFGLHLRGGVELATRRPYPNKRFHVACRKEGRKAINGLLIETRDHVSEFSTVARWSVEAAPPVTHRVTYKIIDQDFAAASDDMTLWYATEEGWTSRWPDHLKDVAPMVAEPLMEIGESLRPRRASDLLDANGFIIARDEVFRMPTLEPERITIETQFNDYERLPKLSSAFQLG